MKVKRLPRLILALAAFALLAPPALAQSAPGRDGDFARGYQEFRTNYLSELRKAGFVGPDDEQVVTACDEVILTCGMK